jgi:hypothetical protein
VQYDIHSSATTDISAFNYESVQCNVHGFATTDVSAITEHEIQGI